MSEERELNNRLEDYDLDTSRVFGQGFWLRELRGTKGRNKPIKINFKTMSPSDIEAELQRGIDIGCKKDKLESIKADYHVFNMVNDKIRGAAMIEVAESTQEIMVQEDGTLLSESNLAQIDHQLAKCKPFEEIATAFGVDVSVIVARDVSEQQNILDLRRRLNAELEDSTIGLAHDFVRLQELQETFELVKTYIMEFEELRTRIDLDPEERLTRMAGLPNIISLITTKDKLIASAQKEMKARKDEASAKSVEFDLNEREQEMFEKLHQTLPILELVVARASVDNGWDPAYMMAKLNKSIYKKFRRGAVGDDYEVVKEKDMTIPYPSEQPVDLEAVVTQTEGRDNDLKLMSDRDKEVPEETLSAKDKMKLELKKRIEEKLKNSKNGSNEKKD